MTQLHHFRFHLNFSGIFVFYYLLVTILHIMYRVKFYKIHQYTQLFNKNWTTCPQSSRSKVCNDYFTRNVSSKFYKIHQYTQVVEVCRFWVIMKKKYVSSSGFPKHTQNEIIDMNKAKEKMFYDIYFIKHY